MSQKNIPIFSTECELTIMRSMVLSFTSAFLLSSCATRTADEEISYMRQLIRTPISSETVSRAKQADAQFLQSNNIHGQVVKFINDSRRDRLLSILNKITNGNATTFNLRVVDSDPKIENAFVTGSNYIYVYTGLIDNAKNDDELAFVLSHELAHVLLRHAQRHDNSYAELAAALTKLAAVTQRDLARKDNLALASDSITSFYSREHESEADALAVLWTKKAGYKPTESANFFQRMINTEQEYKKRIESEKTIRLNKVQEFNAVCQSQLQQLQMNPRLQTIQNKQTLQNNCDKAYNLAQETKDFLKNVNHSEIRSIFARSHPADQERINHINTLTKYVECNATDQQLVNTGRGYFVLMAVGYKRSC